MMMMMIITHNDDNNNIQHVDNNDNNHIHSAFVLDMAFTPSPRYIIHFIHVLPYIILLFLILQY